MDTMEVKKGLGTVAGTHKPIRTYSVVVNGKTVATHTDVTDAYAYAYEYMAARSGYKKSWHCTIK